MRRRLFAPLPLRWTRASYLVLSVFLATLALFATVWWPLVEDYLAWLDPRQPVWTQLDWLLLSIFTFMTLLITMGADVRLDARIATVGLAGGLVIESWGTHSGLWFYFTQERPPLWILPAWPVASLTIERIRRLLDRLLPQHPKAFVALHAILHAGFLALLVSFTWPTRGEPLTLLVWLLCLLLALAPGDTRQSVLAFAAGAGLGYFLELWGTTRQCWTYYTLQTPPPFAVLAHGLAAVAFGRTSELLVRAARRLGLRRDEEPASPGPHAMRAPGSGGPPA